MILLTNAAQVGDLRFNYFLATDVAYWIWQEALPIKELTRMKMVGKQDGV